uniref:Uncharacterized protein n=1 Tax=Lepeophtheirus salmonis TaxID=72036 RepID=A0A0K2UZ57_LEPSM
MKKVNQSKVSNINTSQFFVE